MKDAFIAFAALLLAACNATPEPVMGPVRLVEGCVDIPASAFECRGKPPAPADYFDGLEHSDWIAALWFSQSDCEARLKAAGEMVRGAHAAE